MHFEGDCLVYRISLVNIDCDMLFSQVQKVFFWNKKRNNQISDAI